MNRVAFAFCLALILAVSSSAWGQHYTARFYTDYGSPRKLQDVLFSPTNAHVAVVVPGGPVTVLETATGDVTMKFDLDAHTVAWAADGKRLLAVTNRGTKLLALGTGLISNVEWDLPQGELGLRFKEEAGKLLVSSLMEGSPAAESKKIKVGDEIIGTVYGGVEQSLLGRKVEHLVKALEGPAGTLITLRIVPKGSIKPIDVELRRGAAVKQGNRTVFRELRGGISPQACVVMVDSSLVLLDANSGNVLSAIRTIDIKPSGLSEISPDGRLLAVMSNRVGSNALGLEVFDVPTQARIQFASYDGKQPRSLRFTGDGKRLLVGDFDRVEVYDLEQQAFVKPILIGFNPDTASKPREFKNAGTPLDVRPRFGGDSFSSSSRIRSESVLINSCDTSRDGRLVAVGSLKGECKLWLAEPNQCLATLGEWGSDNVECARLSPNGRWLAYCVKGTLNLVNIDEYVAKAVPGK